MRQGCYTALITPFNNNAVDWAGLEKLIDFQLANDISGLLAVGTTGESPVMTWEEHNQVIETVAQKCQGKSFCIAGTGSNNTLEAMEGTAEAAKAGANAVLLVEPYYNGPSSLEIRREYIAPIAKAFPKLEVIPYVIPGRSGTQLYPEDLALLHQEFPNVHTVKEASGDMANIRRTRQVCGPAFEIFSGDDGLTLEMMLDPEVKCIGAISVMSNLAPKAYSQMVALALNGQNDEARALDAKLKPLNDLVTFKTTETTPHGPVVFRARNPLPVKVMFDILGVFPAQCRPPLGKLTRQAGQVVLEALRQVNQNSPEILAPLGEFFSVDIAARLSDDSALNTVCYENY